MALTTNDALIRISRVTKTFGPVVALDDVSLGIDRGEFFSLLGPSGCGKTTLLRMLAGFDQPTSGEIFIDDEAMSLVPPNRRPTNMVFQNYAIFPHLTVGDNIAYGLRRQRLGSDRTRRIVDDMLDRIRLPGLADRRSNQLSGGQRQRVALARALVMQPKVLLLDEPLSALDKKLRQGMQIELRQLQRQVGITFVFVTHDQEEALSMSDRIAVMSEGRVLQVASPADLYEKPNCAEVASFIGTMNFCRAQVRQVAAGSLVAEAEGLGILTVPHKGATFRQGQTVLIGLRPEKIAISVGDAPRQDSLPGEIRAAAYFGDRSHFHVHIEGREEPLFVATQNVDRQARLEENVPVALTWQPDAAIVLPFD